MKMKKSTTQTVLQQKVVKGTFGTGKDAVHTCATVTMYSVSDGTYKVHFDNTPEYIGRSKQEAETVYNEFARANC